jgi:hypothetical protein
MNFFKKLFRLNKNRTSSAMSETESNDSEEKLIEKFLAMNADNRIKKIMVYGDSGDLRYYELLKYSIIHDPDLHAKMAALKRIHLFKSHADCVLMLTSIGEYINPKALEPYYSMALSKTGIITLKEFEERINGTAK